MITKVTVRYFKRFEAEEFNLSDHVILAGPNNSGKTSLLQAIVVWNLALQRWTEKRGPGSGSKAKQRTGAPLTRKDFTALPLREMDLLWTGTDTALKKNECSPEQKPGQHRVLTICVEACKGNTSWELAFEFRRMSTELVYVRPAPEHLEQVSRAASEINVVHVPPFSGIGSEETRYDRPYQDLLIGQGKPGDILRNLLLEVYQSSDETAWKSLCRQIEEVFGYRLKSPTYEGIPYILCEYLTGIPEGGRRNKLTRLDIASAGSGFHQVLLLLGFFYARPATVLLMDEPDSHQHIILQKQIYDMLRSIATRRRCQLIIATHAEVLIDSTSPEQILSFYKEPHLLISDVDRDQVREALKRLTATDILLAERSEGVLYLEDKTDYDLLNAWARALKHRLASWFATNPFWHSNQGRHPREARGHFFALRAIRPRIKGILLLDGDNRGLPDREVSADGLVIERWERYEIESYLVHPDALYRFIESQGPLFVPPAEKYLRDQLPPAVYRKPLDTDDFLRATPASKTLLPGLFRAASLSITKSEYYLVAEQMQSSEIPSEVESKLDLIARVFEID